MKARGHFISLVAVALVACSGLNRTSGTINPNEPTIVQVDNRGFLDMAVYVLRSSSERIRMGTALGNTKTNLTVPPGLVNGSTPLRFIADPIGSSRASVSEEITVFPGDTVVLTIPPS
ncbi:MAG TPA: hypothetical protein VJ840_09110 [Gemmatimonadaceae bacterium]|nr:hypothetical protein [Gemmatimonadaceae bacterium]